MPEPVSENGRRRARLTRERVLQAALAVADAGGVGSLTIPPLVKELDVKPMSVYHHVANKDDILDALLDIVFAQIELPGPGRDWRVAVWAWRLSACPRARR